MKCEALVKNCRRCERWFKSNERSETCPDCGEDRHCQNLVVHGYRFCSNHGGPSPERGFYGLGRGMTTGQGSTFQLTRLAAKYNEIQREGRILSNRHSLEIVRHRIQQLAERIDLNEAPDRLTTLQKLWQDYTKKRDAGDLLAARVTSMEIDAMFEASFHDYMAWRQMFDALDLDRKMVESEVKVMKDIQAIITAEDAYELAAKLLGAVLNVVDDPNKLKRIQYEFARIVGENPIARSERGGREVIDSE